MNKPMLVTIPITLAALLVACATAPPIPKARMIEPGDLIGAMTVEEGAIEAPNPMIWDYCEGPPFEQGPAIYTADCNVPRVPVLAIGIGWYGKEDQLASNWDGMVWKLYVDEQELDLERFAWEEIELPPEVGENARQRGWTIYLRDLAPGEHTLRFSWTADLALDNGFDVYAPGTYEQVVSFAMIEETSFPVLSSNAESGQHPYRSEKGERDLLLYLPEDYGQDPQQQWPLILFLHGYPEGLETIEMLKREGLPRKLQDEADFPFIVVSPHRYEAGYDFWSQDENVEELMILSEEIQSLFSVDPKRIYLTGASLGANGVWETGLRHPERFAALVPVMGYYGWPFSVPESICDLEDVPVWAFHGKNDELIPVDAAASLVEALKACGGEVQFTVYPDAGHDIDNRVYEEPELYDWLLDHTLE
jgi:predicted esterase